MTKPPKEKNAASRQQKATGEILEESGSAPFISPGAKQPSDTDIFENEFQQVRLIGNTSIFSDIKFFVYREAISCLFRNLNYYRGSTNKFGIDIVIGTEVSIFIYDRYGELVFSKMLIELPDGTFGSTSGGEKREKIQDSNTHAENFEDDLDNGRGSSSRKGNARGPYRKAIERPDPSQPANAEVNRTKQQMKVRFKPELIEAINLASSEVGQTRNEWIEEAVEAALVRRAPEPE